jgi:ribonuclease HI
MSEEPIRIYTDGACKGNPGPGGWGALLMHEGKERELHGGEAQTTNNRMELMAVIESLRALKRTSTVEIHTDSSYVQQGMSAWIHKWKRQGWLTADRKPVKNVDLWRALDELAASHTVTWHWVKGHAGHPGNERADRLANQGVADVLGAGRAAAR